MYDFESIRQDAKNYDYNEKTYTMSYDPMNNPIMNRAKMLEMLSNPSEMDDTTLDDLMAMGHNDVLDDYFNHNTGVALAVFDNLRATTAYVNAVIRDNTSNWKANVYLATSFAIEDIYATSDPDIQNVVVNTLGKHLVQFDYHSLFGVKSLVDIDLIRIALLRNCGNSNLDSLSCVFHYIENSIVDTDIVTDQFVVNVLESLNHYSPTSIATLLEALVFPSNWYGFNRVPRMQTEEATTIAMIEYNAVLTILDQSPMMKIKQSIIKLCTDITGYDNIIRGVYDKMKTFPRIAKAIEDLEREESMQFTLEQYN